MDRAAAGDLIRLTWVQYDGSKLRLGFLAAAEYIPRSNGAAWRGRLDMHNLSNAVHHALLYDILCTTLPPNNNLSDAASVTTSEINCNTPRSTIKFEV